MKTKLAVISGLVTAFSMCTSHQLQAQVSVYEGFNYTAGQDITTVTTDATGLSNWESTTGGIVGTTVSTGLTFGSLTTSGGSLEVTKPTGGGWQFLSAPITSGGAIADGSTLYESYLFQYTGPNGGLGSGDNFGIGVGNDTGANHTMSFLAQSYVSNPNGARINYGDGQGPQFPSGNIFDGNTYMFIAKYTNLGGASTATGWILNVADFNAITAAGPVTETALNNNNMASGTTATNAFTAGSFSASQFAKIGDFMDGDVNYAVDEIRFANNLTSVAPFAAVPEPSTYALLGLGGLGFYLLRRKKARMIA